MMNVLFKSTTLFYTVFLIFASNVKFENAQQASSQRFGYNEAQVVHGWEFRL